MQKTKRKSEQPGQNRSAKSIKSLVPQRELPPYFGRQFFIFSLSLRLI